MGPFLRHTGGQNLDRQLWSKSREEQAEHVVTNSSAEQSGARQLRPVRVQSYKPGKACQRSWESYSQPTAHACWGRPSGHLRSGRESQG